MSIQVFVKGGLGNQLFQFAAGYSLAKRRGTSLFLDVSSYANDYYGRRFSLPDLIGGVKVSGSVTISEGASRRGSALGKLLDTLALRRPGSHCYSEDVAGPFDSGRWKSLGRNSVLDGYFQSEKFFEEHASEIKRLLLEARRCSSLLSIAEDLFSKDLTTIAIHVRRGDFVADSRTRRVHLVCSEKYYASAIDYVVRLLDCIDCRIVFFSDDPKYVESTFTKGLRNCRVVTGFPPHLDLLLMSMADHHVISNSSFSWWGAYLGGRLGQIVVAPDRWYADDRMNQLSVDVVPAGWHRLSIC